MAKGTIAREKEHGGEERTMRRALDPVVLTLALAAHGAATARGTAQEAPATAPSTSSEVVELRVT